MIILVAGALLGALAADPARGESSTRSAAGQAQKGSSSTPGDASHAADDSQRGSRDYAAGKDERTGPPGPGVESGDASSMAGGRTDEGRAAGPGSGKAAIASARTSSGRAPMRRREVGTRRGRWSAR